MNTTLSRNCLACNKTVKGRIDKKFCDERCRNSYNNHQNAGETNFIRNVVNALRKNRRVLQRILGEEEMMKTSKEKLLANGFQFKYHTNIFDNKKGGVYYYCFEYGYLPLDNDMYLLVKRKDGSFF